MACQCDSSPIVAAIISLFFCPHTCIIPWDILPSRYSSNNCLAVDAECSLASRPAGPRCGWMDSRYEIMFSWYNIPHRPPHGPTGVDATFEYTCVMPGIDFNIVAMRHEMV